MISGEGMEGFKVPQKAVIRKGGKYLIVKRSPDDASYPGCWDFPGGKLEPGEDVLRGVEREVLEETSLKVKAIRPVFAFHEIVNGDNMLFLVYLCGKASGSVRLSHEHTEYRWATKKEILRLRTENFLRAFLKNS
jgi:8-oxo-dGTP diphosphatase